MWPPLAASGLQGFVWRFVCYVSLTALISSMCAESFFLDTFSIFSLSFNSLITICLGNILVLFVFRTHWIFMSFIRSGSFIHYSPKYFSAPDSSFPKTAFIHELACVMSHRSPECCLHFPINFFFFVLNDAFFSLSQFAFSIIQICWVPLQKSHFSVCSTGYFLILCD